MWLFQILYAQWCWVRKSHVESCGHRGSIKSIVAVLHGIWSQQLAFLYSKWIHVRPDLCLCWWIYETTGIRSLWYRQYTDAVCDWSVGPAVRWANFQRVVGHSFGGKSSITMYMRSMFSEIEQIWALDSFPGLSVQMIKTKTKCMPYSRGWTHCAVTNIKRLVKYFLMEQGASEMILCGWPRTLFGLEGFVWRFHLAGIAERCSNDYFVQDLWHVASFPNSPNQYPLGSCIEIDRWDDEAIETAGLERAVSLRWIQDISCTWITQTVCWYSGSGCYNIARLVSWTCCVRQESMDCLSMMGAEYWQRFLW